MSEVRYYEVEGAVFRERRSADGIRMEVHQGGSDWGPYTGDWSRVRRQSNPLSLREVKPYMARELTEVR